MARNMSFMLTTPQMRARTKTVTRRVGWWNVKPGEVLNACVQCQGLAKGQKVEVITQIRVLEVGKEPLGCITPEEVVKEGFSGRTPEEFILMFMATHKGTQRDTEVNRIAFEYLEVRTLS
ncbi:MAG: ASCH domain-containing protein [Nitrospiraceae bacterium]